MTNFHDPLGQFWSILSAHLKKCIVHSFEFCNKSIICFCQILVRLSPFNPRQCQWALHIIATSDLKKHFDTTTFYRRLKVQNSDSKYLKMQQSIKYTNKIKIKEIWPRNYKSYLVDLEFP